MQFRVISILASATVAGFGNALDELLHKLFGGDAVGDGGVVADDTVAGDEGGESNPNKGTAASRVGPFR